MNITLHKTTEQDLESLFLFQTDEEANRVAAFNSEDPSDKEAYMTKWTKIVNNPAINMQSIFVADNIVGSVIHFDLGDETNISYWIDRSHWGKGISSRAVKEFLTTTDKKTIWGRVAYDNIGSQKVLEKNGFKRTGTEIGFANGRGKKIEEFVYKLEL